MGALAWRTFDLRKLQRVFPASCASDPHLEVRDDGCVVLVDPSPGIGEGPRLSSLPHLGNARQLRQLAWQLTYLADEAEREDMLVSCAEAER